MSLVLSLFPGIGLLDRAFEEEGFCVVRGPDLIWGGDIKQFHPPSGKFDGVIGGPPCQVFSSLANLARHQGTLKATNLIPEFERCVQEAAPQWFVMENVPRAPPPRTPSYDVFSFLLNNRWCGGLQNRVRRISFGTHTGMKINIAGETFEEIDSKPAVTASRGYPRLGGGNRKIKRRSIPKYSLREAITLQGLPEDFDVPSFTREALRRAVGNGVPYPMALAIARAVREVVP